MWRTQYATRAPHSDCLLYKENTRLTGATDRASAPRGSEVDDGTPVPCYPALHPAETRAAVPVVYKCVCVDGEGKGGGGGGGGAWED